MLTEAGLSAIGAGLGADAGAAVPDGLSAAVSIIQTTWPTSTTSPSSALKEIMPASYAGNSSVALSESTSAIA